MPKKFPLLKIIASRYIPINKMKFEGLSPLPNIEFAFDAQTLETRAYEISLVAYDKNSTEIHRKITRYMFEETIDARELPDNILIRCCELFELDQVGDWEDAIEIILENTLTHALSSIDFEYLEDMEGEEIQITATIDPFILGITTTPESVVGIFDIPSLRS